MDNPTIDRGELVSSWYDWTRIQVVDGCESGEFDIHELRLTADGRVQERQGTKYAPEDNPNSHYILTEETHNVPPTDLDEIVQKYSLAGEKEQRVREALFRARN